MTPYNAERYDFITDPLLSVRTNEVLGGERQMLLMRAGGAAARVTPKTITANEVTVIHKDVRIVTNVPTSTRFYLIHPDERSVPLEAKLISLGNISDFNRTGYARHSFFHHAL